MSSTIQLPKHQTNNKNQTQVFVNPIANNSTDTYYYRSVRIPSNLARTTQTFFESVQFKWPVAKWLNLDGQPYISPPVRPTLTIKTIQYEYFIFHLLNGSCEIEFRNRVICRNGNKMMPKSGADAKIGRFIPLLQY